MSNDYFRVRITTEEAEILESNHVLSLSELNELMVEEKSDVKTLALDPRTAETLRSKLTILLAKIGFDEDYSVTSEGARVEGLIDRFFLETQ